MFALKRRTVTSLKYYTALFSALWRCLNWTAGSCRIKCRFNAQKIQHFILKDKKYIQNLNVMRCILEYKTYVWAMEKNSCWSNDKNKKQEIFVHATYSIRYEKLAVIHKSTHRLVCGLWGHAFFADGQAKGILNICFQFRTRDSQNRVARTQPEMQRRAVSWALQVEVKRQNHCRW